MTKFEEIKACEELAMTLLTEFSEADRIPCFVAKARVMERFGFSKDADGKVPVDVIELTDWVFQFAHDPD